MTRLAKLLPRIRYRPLPLIGLCALAPVAVAQNGDVRKEIVQPIPPGSSAALPQGSGTTGSGEWEAARAQVIRSSDPAILAAVDEWKRLQQSDGFGFAAYANFIMAHPGWPGEARMRSLAEKSINPQSYSPPSVVAFFRQYPPRTATGYARQAQALAAMGDASGAREAARNAWRMGALSVEDESWLLSQYSAVITPDDQVAHVNAALAARATSSAERALALLPPSARLLADARVAMQRKSVDAAAKIQAAQAYGASDPGFLADKAAWLSDSGNVLLARTSLAERPKLTRRPVNAEKWYEMLLANARGASNDGQWSIAYAIASQVDDAYDPGVDVSQRPIGERDDYTSLTWLAGTAAYYQLGRPRDAIGMFERYAGGARSPQTISKGHYWAGRAALSAGDAAAANRYFALAAAYPDQFYGQLALERLQRPITAPQRFADQVTISEAQRTAFDRSELVRAARALGLAGRWQDQSLFLRTIAANVTSDANRVLANELSQKISRPDLAVMVGRKARADGSSAYSLASFPRLSVPGGHQTNWTMIHAITRQESQFDRAAVSHAGARGLMQLMPGTARETAGKVGLAYIQDNLTIDTSYNIQLGSTYFQRMLDYFGGSYPLAIAAYNAGPGNVNKWLRANGDPRMPGGDILRWIETIPIYETKNYVQRVLENAVIYDAIRMSENGQQPESRALSRYLGKQGAG
jgi:soluble lytic murein transglycosylase